MKIRILSESLVSARKKYGNDLVNILKQMDPTPTFKYVEWLCKVSNFGKDIWNSRETLIKFDKISKNLPKKDINQYKTWKELYDVVNNYQTKKQGKDIFKKIPEGAKKIFEDENVLVVLVTSYEASCFYGLGKFCIAATEEEGGSEKWDEYEYEDRLYYYVLDKKHPIIQVVEVFYSGPTQIWDNHNQHKDWNEFVNEYPTIPMDIFLSSSDIYEDIVGNVNELLDRRNKDE